MYKNCMPKIKDQSVARLTDCSEVFPYAMEKWLRSLTSARTVKISAVIPNENFCPVIDCDVLNIQ